MVSYPSGSRFKFKAENLWRLWPAVVLFFLASIVFLNLNLNMVDILFLSSKGVATTPPINCTSSLSSSSSSSLSSSLSSSSPSLSSFSSSSSLSSLPSSLSSDSESVGGGGRLTTELSRTLLHYATTNVTPQLNKEEASLVGGALLACGPNCNLLVFGLGFDSPLWAALNHGGKTVFLEEDANWITRSMELHPGLLVAHHVHYPTNLTQADELLQYARGDKKRCRPVRNLSKSRCKLALKSLPSDIYKTNWDVILVDAPRGYIPEAPGRMMAIFSAGVMARGGNRRKFTDVFVHDVDRPVERIYGQEFLCKENLVAAKRILQHYRISSKGSHLNENFCSTTFGLE